jgi:hypothetical protein
MSDSFKTKKDIELNVRKIAWPGILAGKAKVVGHTNIEVLMTSVFIC